MARKLFGTDGVRGLANTDLTPELALSVARAASSVEPVSAVTLEAPPRFEVRGEVVMNLKAFERMNAQRGRRRVHAEWSRRARP